MENGRQAPRPPTFMANNTHGRRHSWATIFMDQQTEDRCAQYIGRSRRTEDAMSPQPARLMQALLDRVSTMRNGDALPPCWQWIYLHDPVAQSDIGADGHEKLGLFLPPAPFRRRMWAGSELTFSGALALGTPARRTSTITDVVFRQGRSGPLCFVALRHEIEQCGSLCMTERQTLVYRQKGLEETALGANGDPVPAGHFVHAPTLLMRYSALTHNPHRIHYDRDFCRDVETYPGLVVHGPLLATYLSEALRSIRADLPRGFWFRAVAPVFETSPIRIEIEAETGTGRIVRSDGRTAVEARMDW